MNWLLDKLGVHPNAYYKIKFSNLKKIEQLYHEAGGRPGYRMMRQMLANQGISLSVQTVRRYMNVELGLKSVNRKAKYHYHKGPEAYSVSDDLLMQNFASEARNQKWCIDFTYIYFGNKCKRYNCSVIDLYDHRIVASVNGRRINAELAIETVKKAIERLTIKSQ